MKQKVLFSWSGGKDSAMALYEIGRGADYQITALLTTVTQGYERVSMHGVRRELLQAQALSLGYPLEEVRIPKECSAEVYGQIMEEILLKYADLGVKGVIFGDLFLDDVRAYREQKLSLVGMDGIFPLWGRDTSRLSRHFIRLGFKAILTCVDTQTLSSDFVGRDYDERLLADLPSGVDPCGENGEFHTFVHDGPIFNRAIDFKPGEKVLREERFYFCDLIAGSTDFHSGA